MKILSTKRTSNIADYIANFLVIEKHIINIQKFPSSEVRIFIDGEIKSSDSVILFHSLWPNPHDSLLELLLILDLLEAKNIKEIYLVIPFIPYLRQDKIEDNSSVGARMIANLLNRIIIKNIITIDAHSENAMKFFSEKLINLDLIEEFANDIIRYKISRENSIIIAPDQGSKIRAEKLANILGFRNFHFSKKREENEVILAETCIMPMVENIIITDDIIDTGGTIIAALNEAQKFGKNHYIYVSHILRKFDRENIIIKSSNSCINNGQIDISRKIAVCLRGLLF